MATGDLTTLASLEQYLSLASGNADEPMLAALISAASAAISTYCGRNFMSATYDETRNGTGGKAMALKNTPITSVASVTVGVDPVPQSTGFGTAGYFFSDTMLMLRGWRFARGLGNVGVSYTAGYGSVPPDLAQACNELVSLRYKERPHFDMNSENIGGQTTSFITRDFKPSTLSVLDRYKRVVPVT